MPPELRQLITDDDWSAYHAIRRRVLFELRGDPGYDENRPDERRAGHYPFLLWDAGTAVGVIRIDIEGDSRTPWDSMCDADSLSRIPAMPAAPL